LQWGKKKKIPPQSRGRGKGGRARKKSKLDREGDGREKLSGISHYAREKKRGERAHYNQVEDARGGLIGGEQLLGFGANGKTALLSLQKKKP